MHAYIKFSYLSHSTTKSPNPPAPCSARSSSLTPWGFGWIHYDYYQVINGYNAG